MELTTHKLRISQSTVNTIPFSCPRPLQKYSSGPPVRMKRSSKPKTWNAHGARELTVSLIPTSLGKATVSAVTAVTTAESIF